MLQVFIEICKVMGVSPNPLKPDPVMGTIDPDVEHKQKIAEHLAQVVANVVDPEIERLTRRVEALQKADEPKSKLIIPGGAGR